MLNTAKIAQAAQLLAEARRTGRPLRELPADCKPQSVDDSNAIIEAITAQLDETIVGWKITFIGSPNQRPFLCPMFASRVFTSPAQVPLSLTPSLRIEPEISFRLKHDLPPRAMLYKPAEVAEALLAAPSLEIVDTRFDTRHRSLRQMIDDRVVKLEAFSDHITTGAYITGTPRGDWQDFDFAAMRMVMRTSDRIIVETLGGHALMDPFLPCVVLANMMRKRDGLKAGQVLVTGSFSGFFEVKPDEPVTAEFEGFGTAEATFVGSA